MDERSFLVVRDSDGRYSVSPASRDLPMGHQVIGSGGTRDECLDRAAALSPTPSDLAAYLA